MTAAAGVAAPTFLFNCANPGAPHLGVVLTAVRLANA
jgi:hypothetical protein